MEVRKAEFAGACYGVQRALDMAAAAAAAGGTVQSLGPLIHNPVVVAKLEASGVQEADTIDDITADAVIVRSHGVGPQVRAALEAGSARVVDATCPHVYRAQKAAADLARALRCVIVVGDAKHPEVEGLCAYAVQAGGQVHVAASPDDLPVDLPEAVGVVVQTTQSRAVFDAVLAALAARASTPKCAIRCTATTKRQKAAAELAGQVDAIVVIGGHNSSEHHAAPRDKGLCPQTVASRRLPSWTRPSSPGQPDVTAGRAPRRTRSPKSWITCDSCSASRGGAGCVVDWVGSLQKNRRNLYVPAYRCRRRSPERRQIHVGEPHRPDRCGHRAPDARRHARPHLP